MRCLNPECGSVTADELNVSLNLSMTYEQEVTEYTAETEYGDLGDQIGTWCSECQRRTYLPNWLEVVARWVGPSGDDLLLVGA